MGIAGTVLLLVVVAGVLATPLWIALFTSLRKQATLDALNKLLGGGRDETSAWGAALGAAATLRFTIRGSGQHAKSWTEVEVELPTGYPLELHLRSQEWGDKSRIANGELVDLTLGDPRFDASFVVEAAPADIVRTLLDARVRSLLYFLPTATLSTTRATIPMLRLEVDYAVDADEARAIVTALTALSVGLPAAYERAEGADPPLVTGAPFRQQIDDSAARDAAAARDAEVGHIRKLQSQRPSRGPGIGIVLGIIVGLGHLIATLAR